MQPFDDAETISLEVIDATLAGEAVEPEYAELAELTLILAGQRPDPSPTFVAALDDRVARRFAPVPSRDVRRSRRGWLYLPGAAVTVAALIAVVIVAGNGGASSSASSSSSASAAPVAGQALSTAPAHRTSAGTASTQAAAPTFGTATSAAGGAGGALGPAAVNTTAASSAASAPAPVTPGRQIIQSAQLSLAVRPRNVANVAQQVFDVVAAQNGVVENSQVTATNSSEGYAQFQLSVPSANLSQTMAELSRLHDASVVSRTDATQDVTGELGAAGMRLAEARALRTSLLRQLQNATTTAAVDSLRVQIRDVDASIASDEATLNNLHHQVAFSQISLTINASIVPPFRPVASGSSFTIGKAAHDAGRVLVVAAGAGLIALAVLVPLSMVAAVVLWVAFAIRRKRREQALDLV